MSIRRNTQQVVPFPAIDVNNPPARLSGLTWTAGQTQISKDGGAFANTTNQPVEIGSTGRYSVTLTATETDAVWIMLKMERSEIQPWDISLATAGHPSGTVVANGGNTATTFKTSLTEASNDYWKDVLILFTSGTLTGQVRKVVTYTASTAFVILSSALTSTPTAGDRFVLVNY